MPAVRIFSAAPALNCAEVLILNHAYGLQSVMDFKVCVSITVPQVENHILADQTSVKSSTTDSSLTGKQLRGITIQYDRLFAAACLAA